MCQVGTHGRSELAWNPIAITLIVVNRSRSKSWVWPGLGLLSNGVRVAFGKPRREAGAPKPQACFSDGQSGRMTYEPRAALAKLSAEARRGRG